MGYLPYQIYTALLEHYNIYRLFTAGIINTEIDYENQLA